MADFSKEYCDNHDPGFPHDFSIEEEAKGIPNGHYRSVICEGYGFVAIGKGEAGEIFLYFVINYEKNEFVTVPLEELENYYKKNYPHLI